MILTFLAEYPTVYQQVKNYVRVDDFIDDTYREVAGKFFEDIENGTASPARMVNMFQNPDEQNKVSDLFTCYLKGLETKEDKEIALVDIIYQLKNNSFEAMKNKDEPINPNVFMAKKKELMEIRRIKINIP